jgi:gamma-glutamyltranspeptidase/glutathione hydrolase
VGVPGEPAGLAELVRRFGKLPFSRCVEPALRLARHGFAASTFLIKHIQDELARNATNGPALVAELFDLRGRAPGSLRPGDRLTRSKLAGTLTRLRAGGPLAFYRGAIARSILAGVAKAGGVMSLGDLASYAPVERTVLETIFRGRRVLLPPPPSAGGLIIAQALGMFSDTTVPLPGNAPLAPAHLHRLAEALKHGFADRARFLGDPGFSPLPLPRLLDPAYHRELASRLRPDGVLPHDAYGTRAPLATTPARDGGTAHVSVVDAAGNAVSLTSTVNLEFGARIVVGGIVLNDELDDFTPAAGRPDVFTLSGGDANRAAPSKRPLSSMSPTIVLGAHGVELVAGAAGGPRIVSATLQLLLAALLFDRTAEQAMRAPRIHHQWEPDTLFHEPGLTADALDGLGRRGHRLELRPDIGKANLIIRSSSGLDAAADPRSGGAAAGF